MTDSTLSDSTAVDAPALVAEDDALGDALALIRTSDVAFDVEPSDDSPGVVDPASDHYSLLATLVQDVVESDQAAEGARLAVEDRLAAIRQADPDLARLEEAARIAADRGRQARAVLARAFQDRTQGVKVVAPLAHGDAWAVWAKPAVAIHAGRDLKKVLTNAEARIERKAVAMVADGRFGADLDVCRRLAAEALVRDGDGDVQAALHLRLHRKMSARSAPRFGFSVRAATPGEDGPR